jgi:TRAP-type transport system periplasmic protein
VSTVKSLGLLAVLPLLAVAGCGGDSGSSGSGGGGKSVTIKLSFQAAPSPTDPWNHMAEKFKSLVEGKSGGRVQVKLFGGGQLSGGNQSKEIELVQQGSIDASILPSGTLATVEPRFQVVELPWMVPSDAAADKVMDGDLGKSTLPWLEAKGMHPLAIASNGFRELANNKRPVRTPADVANLKIRIPGNEVLTKAWSALGAQPSDIDFAELYPALQQKTVDGEELPFVYKLSTKFYEVEKYATQLNYSFDLIYLVVGAKTWGKLDADTQKILTQAASEAAQDERQFIAQQDKSAIQQLRQHGMQVVQLSPQQVDAFKAKMAPVYAQFNSSIGADLIKRWQGELSG